LAAIFLQAQCPGYAAPELSGVWTLNRAKSDFGTVIAPEQFVVRMERTGNRLAAWRITIDPEGKKHLAYREYTIEGKGRSSVDLVRSTRVSIEFPREATRGTKTDERWQVSKRRLIIHRSITAGPRKIHQRLVLDPATRVQGTNEAVREE
jgi:hypothetical protein